MKKIYLIFIALLSFVLILTSCNRVRRFASSSMVTPMPIAVEREVSVDIGSKDESTSENEPSEGKPLDENFEKLRDTVLSFASEGEGLELEVARQLVGYDDSTIILAKVLPYNSQGAEDGTFDWDKLPATARVMMIAAETFELNNGILEETGLSVAPILVTVDEAKNSPEKIFVPEMYDPQKRAEDITKIFGVEKEEDLGLIYFESLYQDFIKELSAMKYDIALADGFDGFQNKTIEMLGLLSGSEFVNTADMEGAIRDYFIRSTFSYDRLTVPVWLELGREELSDGIKLYAAMYFGEIRSGQGSEPETGIYFAPVVIDMEFTNDTWQVRGATVINADGQALIDGVNENFGDYADECLAFSGTQEAQSLKLELERIQNSLIDGTFATGD